MIIALKKVTFLIFLVNVAEALKKFCITFFKI